MRRVLVPVLAAALALGAACSGGSSSSPADPQAPGAQAGRDTLVVATMADLGNLNPIVYETASDAFVLNNVYLPVTDFSIDCQLKHEPSLATAWAWNEDSTELTLTLRDDITWSDGKPVTAHDIAFTYEMVRNPEVASPRLAYVQRIADGYPKATGDHTVVFRFTTAYDHTTQLSHASLLPLPKHVFESADAGTLRGHEVSLTPLSSGPWTLAKHEKNSRYVLEHNPHFTGPDDLVPQLKRVVFRVIPEYATRLVELKNGGVDLMDGLNIEDVDALKKDHPEIRIASRGYRTSDYIGWNSENELFADKEVRRALTMAIDIDGMIGKLLTGADGTRYARPMVSTVTPELCAVHADDIPLLPHDPDKAKALLAAKGWSDTDGDGILDKAGKPFRFTLKTNAGNKRRADASILIQSDLKKVGVDVQLAQQESNSFFEDLRKRDYEAALAGWSAALFVDPSSIWGADQPGKRNEFNFTGYNNPAAEALINKGLSEPDPEAAIPTWKELQRVIYDDQPYTFLWWREELVGVHSRFENTKITPGSLLDDLHDWSVPADKVKYPR